MLRATDFRAGARQALSGRWKIAILAGIIVTLVTNASVGGLGLNFDIDSSGLGLIAGLDLPPFISENDYITLAEIWLPIGFGVILLAWAVVTIVIGSPLKVGYARFNLRMVDGDDPQLGDLLSCYGRMKTIVWADVLRFLYILGGTFLFIIPGIIANYTYRLTEYILAEHPELTAKEVLEKSSQMMNGNRWRLFCLDSSFIGWSIMSAFAFGIGNLWLKPYQEAAWAAFYRSLTQATEPIPVVE